MSSKLDHCMVAILAVDGASPVDHLLARSA
ncbi:hypothetical protein LMG29660_02912 [Burkholderia puraquae]|nr:hypothetical protein LMG29660_02912 [Burkholderia puraquae]